VHSTEFVPHGSLFKFSQSATLQIRSSGEFFERWQVANSSSRCELQSAANAKSTTAFVAATSHAHVGLAVKSESATATT